MEFATLNDILDIEINNGIADQNGSASGSLLWLVRNLMFIHDFLRRFAESDINSDSLIKDCLGAAYESCLRKYHTPVIHNVFSVSNFLLYSYFFLNIKLVQIECLKLNVIYSFSFIDRSRGIPGSSYFLRFAWAY